MAKLAGSSEWLPFIERPRNQRSAPWRGKVEVRNVRLYQGDTPLKNAGASDGAVPPWFFDANGLLILGKLYGVFRLTRRRSTARKLLKLQVRQLQIRRSLHQG